MSVKDSVKNFFSAAKTHWKTPAEGRYMSYKEILSLSVGGIGVRFIVYCIGQMIISVGNTLIGNTIGITPTAVYAIYLISVLSGFPLTALRARMIDNTRSLKGKYRPYILTMGIPSVILGAGFILTPYEHMGLAAKCAAVLAFNIGFQFFYNFYTDAYESIINVLSPNTIERSDVLSVRSVIENLSPSIANILLPVLARLITGKNTLYDLRIYRILFPPMLLAGFVISMLVYVNTEEKIVQARTHPARIRFADAFRAVAKNKYFWIISLAGWVGFLEGSYAAILGWLYNYQNACTPAQYSVIIAISGNASFWPNLVAPFLVRKFGKRKVLVTTNLLNIVFILAMLPVIKMTGSPSTIWLLLVFIFINTFMSAIGHLLGFGINADIRDYQQYITGERIDGMFAVVGLIGSVVTLVTSSVLPVIYERSGLNSSVALSLGFDGSNVYDVLYNTDYFIKICSVLVIASAIGATLNVIPFFFYDLTEPRQRAMVQILKIRAVIEDESNGVYSDEKAEEAKRIVADALAGDDETSLIVAGELRRYTAPEGAREVEIAEKLFAGGTEGFMTADLPDRRTVRKLPRSTEAEKTCRRDLLMLTGKVGAAKAAAKKYFPDGIREFDVSVFETLFERESEQDAAIRAKLAQIKAAREQKSGGVKKLKGELKALRAGFAETQRLIKKATDENAVYNRAAAPYIEAKRILSRRDGYKKLIDGAGLWDA